MFDSSHFLEKWLYMFIPVVDQAHKVFNSLVEKIAAKYEQLDSRQ